MCFKQISDPGLILVHSVADYFYNFTMRCYSVLTCGVYNCMFSLQGPYNYPGYVTLLINKWSMKVFKE